MTVNDILKDLEKEGSKASKEILLRHGAREPFFGVKIAYLKKLQKKIKKNYKLSMALYNTGNSDAMYLAGLVSDPLLMSKSEIQDWAEKAYWYMLSEYTVAWVAAESNFGWELSLEWIDSGKENLASAGWSTLAGIVSLKCDSELDINKIKNLLGRVEESIHREQNRVKYTMNGFIISVGSYITELNVQTRHVAENIGKISVGMGGTTCKVPIATDYIKKVEDMGRLGRKKKTVFC